MDNSTVDTLIATLLVAFAVTNAKRVWSAHREVFDLRKVTAGPAPVDMQIAGAALAVALAVAGLAKHEACTTISSADCRPFFLRSQLSLYLLVCYIGELLSGPQLYFLCSFTNLSYIAYELFPCAFTCRLAILTSVLLFIYHLAAVGRSSGTWRCRTAAAHALAIETMVWLTVGQTKAGEDRMYMRPGDYSIFLSPLEISAYVFLLLPLLWLFSVYSQL